MNLKRRSCALALSTLLAMAGHHADACTSLVLNATDGGRVYGRTMEFGIPLHSQAMLMPRGYAFQGIGPDGTPGTGKSWKSKYAVIGANVFGMPLYVDGMNEAGLTGGLLNAPNSAQYQDPPAGEASNSIAPQQLLTYVLTNFATVEGVRQALPKMYVNNAPMKEWGGTPKAHMTLLGTLPISATMQTSAATTRNRCRSRARSSPPPVPGTDYSVCRAAC
jgi:choloylglycine hydrolase